MRQFVYHNYSIIIMIALILASLSIYVINVYNTGFFGGLVSGFLSAIAFGLLVTPKRKFLKEDQ